ncbi:MAG TPA: hypothetical protein VMP67_11835 [Candidatus Limnocylindria bacterium]|nr:hypothetical protein [Candidatus Limnocylindria bacterium]
MAVPLVRHFAGLDARWAPPEKSDAAIIGSIAGQLPRGYGGVIVGIGKIRPDVDIDLSAATVLGLRGELTLRGAGVRGDIALGDTGLLAIDLLGERPAVAHALGVVPHYLDQSLAGRYPSAFRIDVGGDPLVVIRQIASCQRIVSSSLHGLVTADSLGIARMWEPYAELKGGRFKFDDYASALGIKLEPGGWDTAPQSAVARARSALRDAMKELSAALSAPPKPAGRGRISHLLRRRPRAGAR